jgi:hypothetical protein
MTQNQTKHVNAKAFEMLDTTMPGRRFGSTLPEDCTPAAKAALERLRDRLPEHLALTTVLHFLQQQGERHDEPFARAFRKEVILCVLGAESRKL